MRIYSNSDYLYLIVLGLLVKSNLTILIFFTINYQLILFNDHILSHS